MKRYVNCCDDGRDDSIHTTAKGARDYAAKWGGYYAVAVEVELPDPPHEWKVGDWAMFAGWAVPARIVDMHNGAVCLHWRSACGDYASASWVKAKELPQATPCDPPAWFTEDGES